MSCHYTILNNEALLQLDGPDALAFLQGQTTCDTRTVDASHAIVGAYCTPKGRVVCDFLLCQITENTFALRLRRDIIENSAAVFGKYIVFSKAELHPANQDWKVFACWGEDARTALHTALQLTPVEATPGERYTCSSGEGFVLVQVDDAGKQFECYVDTANYPGIGDRLVSTLPPGDANSWQALQIEQGVGRIEAATVEAFIPQMLNYDLTGHISFNKGCYTGQEVVARLHYRGKPKRRLYQATMDENLALQPGTQLYTAESQQSAGTLVNSAQGSNGLPVALIVAPVSEDRNTLHVGDPNGPILSYDESYEMPSDS